MQQLMSEDPYAQMIDQFSTDPECRELIRHTKKYRLKNGSLCVHEEDQDSNQQYWRIIVPDNQRGENKRVKRDSLRSLCWTSGVCQNIGNREATFLLESHDSRGKILCS